ncbi:hypothetical protein [Armatimonas sp.]|uniref:hypothetical protein n=1 Tax=Armatimonas sp. TaxID=1872638 RepID=UPI00374CB5C4
MQPLIFFTVLSLLNGTPQVPQEPQTAPLGAPQESVPATGRDYFLFTKALKSLRQGQLTSLVTMDIKGEGLAVVLKGQIHLTHKTSGAYMSELSVLPPLGGKPKRYKVTHDSKTTWVQDLGAGTYALQKVTEENEFLVRGLLTGLAKTALEKLEPSQLKFLDAAEPTPELAVELEKAVKQGDGDIKVRDETLEGKIYRVYDLQPGKEKGVISIYVTSGHRPERLSMLLDQDKLKIKFTEVVSSLIPTIPEKTSFRFVPTRSLKKVKKIDLGNY